MNSRCDNCGSNTPAPRVVTIVHVPSRETATACAPCASAMVRAMPTAWARAPKGL
jgi:hypothetical protein